MSGNECLVSGKVNVCELCVLILIKFCIRVKILFIKIKKHVIIIILFMLQQNYVIDVNK